MDNDRDDAREQAALKLAAIREMVARLDHASTCNGGAACELSGRVIAAALDYNPETIFTIEDALDHRAEYHEYEDARECIQEHPLSLEVRSAWVDVGETFVSAPAVARVIQAFEPAEYCILLCTGGPAVRIVGDLQDGQPVTARIEYQSWGTPWIDFPLDRAAFDDVVTYASQFYFG